MGILEGLGKIFTPVLEFAPDENKFATALLLVGIGGAFSPDAIDVERERHRLNNEREDEERLRREGNLKVGGIQLGMKPSESKKFLSDSGTATDPSSIIAGRARPRRPGLINGNM